MSVFDRMNGPAPTGLQQQQQSAPDGGGGSVFDRMSGPVTEGNGTRRQTWITGGRFGTPGEGGRFGSLENGYNTEFNEKRQRQQDELEKIENEKERADAAQKLPFSETFTGVIGQDMVDKDGSLSGRKGTKLTYGDVYEDGRRLGSLTDNSMMDKSQGQVLLAEYLLETETKNRAYQNMVNDETSIEKALAAQRTESEKAWNAVQGQGLFEDRVDRIKGDWNDDTGILDSVTAIGASALGGAASGAAFGPWGALAGAVVGGVGGYLNQDEIIDNAARAAAQTEMAGEDQTNADPVSTGMRAWGGVGMTALQPFQNIVRGGTDAIVSEGQGVGDGESEYHNMAEKPWLLEAGNFAATLADGAANAMSPAARAAYMGTIGTYAAGGVGQVAFHDFTTFDDRRGDFYTPQTAAERLAAAYSVGIDGIQMASMGVLGKAMGRIGGADRAVLNQTDDVVEAASRKGESMGGMVFKRDTDGTVIGARPSVEALLVPSTAIQYLGTTAKAQIRWQKNRGNAGYQTPEDYKDVLYRAASDEMTGSNMMGTVTVNALGEGMEEGVQSATESISHGWAPDTAEMWNAFVYGAAGGAGMTIGARLSSGRYADGAKIFGKSFNQDEAELKMQASLINKQHERLGTGHTVTVDELRSMTPEQRAEQVQTSPQVMAGSVRLMEQIHNEQQTREVSMIAMGEVLLDQAERQTTRELQAALPADEATHLVRQLLNTREFNQEGVYAGVGTIRDDLFAHFGALRVRAEADPESPAAQAIAYLQGPFTANGQDTGMTVEQFLTSLLDDIARTDLDNQARTDSINLFNRTMESWWNSATKETIAAGVLTPQEVLATLAYSRSPNDQAGSMQSALPQIDIQDTLSGLEGVRGVAWERLQRYSMDFDGDTSSLRIWMATESDPVLFANMRNGMANIASTSDARVLTEASPAVKANIKSLSESVALNQGVTSNLKDHMLEPLRSNLKNIFSALRKDRKQVARQLVDELILDMRGGDQDAVDTFLQKLNTMFPDEMETIANEGAPGIRPRSDIYLQIQSRIGQALEDWRVAQSVRLSSNPTLDPIAAVPAANQPGDRQQMRFQGATLGQTVMIAADGPLNPVRVSQQLYYTGGRTGAIDPAKIPDAVMQMQSEAYISLTSGVREETANTVLKGNEVHHRALRMLETFAERYTLENPMSGEGQAARLAALAAMPYPDFRQDDNGNWLPPQRFTTLGAYLVKQSAFDLEKRERLANATDEDLKKFQILQNIGNADALFYLLGNFQSGAILGEAGRNLPYGMTLGEIRDYFARLGEGRRDVFMRRWRSDFRAEGKTRQDLPHSMEQFESGDTNVYNAFLAALDESVRGARKYDSVTKKLTGTEVEANNREIDNLEKAQVAVRTALLDLARAEKIKLNAKKPSAERTQALADLINTLPGKLGRSIFEMIPEAHRVVTLWDAKTNQFVMPQWFEDFLLSDNPGEASVLWMRHLWLTDLRKMEADLKEGRLPSDDLLRLTARLQEKQLDIQMLLDIMTTSKSLYQVQERINEEFVTEDMPPFLALRRDTALHDKLAKSDPWDFSLGGTDQRVAISDYLKLGRKLEERRQALTETDRVDETLSLMSSKLTSATTEAEAEAMFPGYKLQNQQYQTALKVMRKHRTPLGPEALMRGIVSAVTGLQVDMADKGKTNSGVEQNASQILKNDRIAQTGAGVIRMTAATVGVQTGSYAARNIRALAQEGGTRLRDDNGLEFHYELPRNLLELVQAWADPAARPRLRAQLLPHALEYVDGGYVEEQVLGSTSIMGLLSGDNYNQMVLSKERAQKLRLLSMLDARLPENELQNWIAQIATSWASQNKTGLVTEAQTQAKVMEAAEVVADLVHGMMLKPEANWLPELQEQISANRWEQLLNERKVKDPKGFEERRRSMQLMIDRSISEISESTELFLEQSEMISSMMSGSSSLFDLGQIYSIDWANPEEVKRKKELFIKAVNSGSADRVIAGGKKQTAAALLKRTGLFDSDGLPQFFPTTLRNPEKNEKKNQEMWDQLGRELAGLAISRAAQHIPSPDLPAAPVPNSMIFERALRHDIRDITANDPALLMDPTFTFLFAPMLGKDSAIRREAQALGNDLKTPAELGAATVDEDRFDSAIRKLSDRRKTGQWTEELAVQLQSLPSVLTGSAGATPAIGLVGQIQDRLSAQMFAVEQPIAPPAPTVFRTAHIESDMLQLLISTDAQDIAALEDAWFDRVNPGQHDASGRATEYESLAMLTGRAVSRVVLRRGPDTDVIQPGDSIDLMTSTVRATARFNPELRVPKGLENLRAKKLAAALAEYREEIMDSQEPWRLEIDYVHPEDQPADGENSNNPFYEGTVLEGTGQRTRSLIGAWMYNVDGESARGQRTSLDAAVKGTQALKDPDVPTAAEIAEIEAGWAVDFFDMLRQKVERVTMVKDNGIGVPDRTWYNSHLKQMKMLHAVRVPVDGEWVYYSAEQVIAAQRPGGEWASPGLDSNQNPISRMPEGAELFRFDETTFNTMIGAANTFVLPGSFKNSAQYQGEPENSYRSDTMDALISKTMPQLKVVGNEGSAVNTDLNRISFNRQVSGPSINRLGTDLALVERLSFYRSEQTDAYHARNNSERARTTDQSADLAQKAAYALANRPNRISLQANEVLSGFGFRNVAIPVAQQFSDDPQTANAVLEELGKISQEQNIQFTRGFFYTSGHAPALSTSGRHGYLQGLNSLTVSKTDRSTGEYPVFEDFAFIDVTSFPETEAGETELRQVLNHFAEKGLYIVFAYPGSGGMNHMNLARQVVQGDNGYRPISGGNLDAWRPMRTSDLENGATARAKMMKKAQTVNRDLRGTTVGMYVADSPVAENNTLRNDLELDAGGSFVIPKAVTIQDPPFATGFVRPTSAAELQTARKGLEELLASEATMRHVFQLSVRPEYYGSEVGKPVRMTEAELEVAYAEFVREVRYAYDNTQWDETADLPERGMPKARVYKGMILPRVGQRGQLWLDRLGHQPHTQLGLYEQREAPMPASWPNPLGAVVVSSIEPIASTTIQTGEAISWRVGANNGLLEGTLRQTARELESKTIQYGFKTVSSRMSQSRIRPGTHVVPGSPLGILGSLTDFDSKGMMIARGNDAQTLATYIGLDTTQPFVEAMLDDTMTIEKWSSLTIDERGTYIDQVRSILWQIRRTLGSNISLDTMDVAVSTLAQDTGTLTDQYLIEVLSDPAVEALLPNTLLRDQMVLPEGDLAPQQKIAAAMMMWMMTDAARDPNEVMGSTGLRENNDGTAMMSREMPSLFTQLFDLSAGSALDTWFIARMNDRFREAHQGGMGFEMDANRGITMVGQSGSQHLTDGVLTFGEFSYGGVSGTQTRNSADQKIRRKASDSEAKVQRATGLGRQFLPGVKKLMRRHEEWADSEAYQDVSTIANLYGTIIGTHIDRSRVRPLLGKVMTRRQRDYLLEADTAVREYYQPLGFEEEAGWTPKERTSAEEAVSTLLTAMGWDPVYYKSVHAWARMYAFAPREKDGEGAARGHVTPNQFHDAMQRISVELGAGRFPTAAAPLAALTEQDVARFYEQAKRDPGNFEIEGTRNADGTVKDYEYWVNQALGMLAKSDLPSTHRLLADGIWHTFRNLGLQDLSDNLSMDEITELELLSPAALSDTLSLNMNIQEDLMSPDVAEAYLATLREAREGRIKTRSESSGARSLRTWASRANVPSMRKMTVAQQQEGAARRFFGRHASKTPEIIRIMIGLRTLQGMANPILWLWGGAESARQGIVEDIATTFSGYSTGPFRKMMERAGLGDFMAMDLEEAILFRSVLASVGEHPEFSKMINQDSTPERPDLTGARRPERLIQKGIDISGRMQELINGIGKKTHALRYLRGAIMALDTNASMYPISRSNLIRRFSENPTFLRDDPQYETLHAGGLAAVMGSRTLQPSTLTAMWRGTMDPATTSNRTLLNVTSNLTLNMTERFMPFLFNTSTSIMGGQGLNVVMALAAGLGRNGDQKWGKLQSWIRGEKWSEDQTFSIQETVLDGVNITNEFAKSGVTIAGLFALGMLAQSMGLDGEDEEERRQRRLAQLSGVSKQFDPRELERDFRNKDAIYFHNLPGWLESSMGLVGEMAEVVDPETGKSVGGSMLQMHWALKMFASPIMGVSRALNTGDFREIYHGFEDALGSMPLVNIEAYDKAVRIAEEALAASESEVASGDPSRMPTAFSLLTGTVMHFEKMLLENAFVNELYSGLDPYYREAYALPDRDADNNIQVDDLGNPMEADAYNQYVGADGTIGSGHMAPNPEDVDARKRAQTNFSYALIDTMAKVVTLQGTSSSYIRYNQPVREVSLERPGIEQTEAIELILSQWDPKNEREVLTLEGSTGIIQGLRMGTLKPGDPALQNVFIGPAERSEIQDIFTAMLYEEAYNIGLDEKAADRLVTNTMYGSPYNRFATPLYDVIWSQGKFQDSIPYDSKVKYKQLNTTFVMGPDGKPWATGFSRQAVLPFQRQLSESNGALPTDSRVNSVDEFAGVNTGMRGLQRVEESTDNITDQDIKEYQTKNRDDIIEAIKEELFALGNRLDDGYGGGGRGGGGFARRGGGGGGGGRGGSGGGGGYSVYRITPGERNNVIYNSNDPYVRSQDPNIRRATIRRERYSATRGRLNQWQ